MSNHVSLNLHRSEETISCDFSSALTPFPKAQKAVNPITDYFSVTANLVKKIIDTKYADDSEILGLLVLGVVSSAEFYFRAILSQLSRQCPICELHTEALTIPKASFSFYSKSNFAPSMSAFEHESLADSKKIISEVRRFTNFNCVDSTSVKKALDDFELLCELRHCFIHARGFAGLKASRAIGGSRTLQKVLINQTQALDFIKLSHNAVRAMNHYLGDEILNRWIQRDVLVGNWRQDKSLFSDYLALFVKQGEDEYDGIAQKSYSLVKHAVVQRKQAIAAKVASPADQKITQPKTRG